MMEVTYVSAPAQLLILEPTLANNQLIPQCVWLKNLLRNYAIYSRMLWLGPAQALEKIVDPEERSSVPSC